MSFDTPLVVITGSESRFTTRAPIGGASLLQAAAKQMLRSSNKGPNRRLICRLCCIKTQILYLLISSFAHFLLSLPLHEPAFVEVDTDAKANVVFSNLSSYFGLYVFVLYT